MDITESIKKFLAHDLRTLSKLISLAENQDPIILLVLSQLYSRVGQARVIGITGPPGAGKSTLIGEFIRYVRAQNKKVAVVAVDPVSPFSGGSVLGDRIRLQEHFNDEGVYIRSLSTRGTLGGLSKSPRQVLQLLDAFGFDYILLETVGVGQSEVEIRRMVDLTALVLVPEWGDSIQALKAGILEIADIFLVNKADREGADRIVQEIKGRLEIQGQDSEVLATVATDSDKVKAIFQRIDKLWVDKQDLIKNRRKQFAKDLVRDWIHQSLMSEVENWISQQNLNEKNPYVVLEEFYKAHPKGRLFSK